MLWLLNSTKIQLQLAYKATARLIYIIGAKNDKDCTRHWNIGSETLCSSKTIKQQIKQKGCCDIIKENT